MNSPIHLKELACTGLRIPEVGLGTWNYHGGPIPLRRGLEATAGFIDTAESYGTESVVGEAVRGIRDQVFIATKVSPEHFRSDDLRRSADSSLKSLGIDHIDLYQLHEPSATVPIEETMGELENLANAGKIRYIGVSNFSIEQLARAQKALTKHRIVSNQVRYSLIDRTIESGLLTYCRKNYITVIAYSPLGREFSRIGDCDPSNVIGHLASITGKTPAQIVINWCLCKDGVLAIPKGNSTEHILENCGASGWRLSPEQLLLLDSRIQYRRRNRFDTLIRRWTPQVLRMIGKQAVRVLPRRLRRRVH